MKLPQLNLKIEEDIERIEKDEGIHFALKQKRGNKRIGRERIACYYRGPGTGKTTTINAIIKILKKKI